MTVAEPGTGVDPSSLHRVCLAYLAQEEELLTRLAQGLGLVHDALAAGGQQAIEEATRLQVDLERDAANGRGRRARWKHDLGRALAIPEHELRLEKLASRFSEPARTELLAARARVARLMDRIQERSRSTVALLRAYRAVLDRFFLDLTGTPDAGLRYGPAGRQLAPAYDSLLQVRG